MALLSNASQRSTACRLRLEAARLRNNSRPNPLQSCRQERAGVLTQSDASVAAARRRKQASAPRQSIVHLFKPLTQPETRKKRATRAKPVAAVASRDLWQSVCVWGGGGGGGGY